MDTGQVERYDVINDCRVCCPFKVSERSQRMLVRQIDLRCPAFVKRTYSGIGKADGGRNLKCRFGERVYDNLGFFVETETVKIKVEFLRESR